MTQLKDKNYLKMNTSSAIAAYSPVTAGVDLKDANLSESKSDFFSILRSAPYEVSGLYDALMQGRIEGSTYEGTCACLVGTIANLQLVDFGRIPGVIPDPNRPAERWFLAIWEGATPENSQVAQITSEWIEEWARDYGIQVSDRALVSPAPQRVKSTEQPVTVSLFS
jgi:hypothetical protein